MTHSIYNPDGTISIGQTSVELSIDWWIKHGRQRCEVRIICVDANYSEYDGIRDTTPKIERVIEAVEYIINEENQAAMAGYTNEQIKNLQVAIAELIQKGESTITY